MAMEDKLNVKEAAKKAAITDGLNQLQETINAYEPNLDSKVKLAEHTALDQIIGQAIALKVLVNELGLVRNLGKRPRRAAEAAGGRARRNR